ncbi:hypothetical protein IFM89_035872 [Coptis chinensis]|uniref:Uncharacterized protein n=1 Tax=Coptis chinensis TaxID=261450 RepID=A0A835H1E7_9MAGN|nr:hypothetical protein IFM89_035872 [Coptis chinensis]
MKYKQDTRFMEDGFGFGFPPYSYTIDSSIEDDDYPDSDDMTITSASTSTGFCAEFTVYKTVRSTKIGRCRNQTTIESSKSKWYASPIIQISWKDWRGRTDSI